MTPRSVWPATSGWVTTARCTSRNRAGASGERGKSLTIIPWPRAAVSPMTPSPTVMGTPSIHSGQLKAACGRRVFPASSSRYTASGVGVEQLGGAAADHGHQGVPVALAGDLPFDLAERLQPPQAARGDSEERRAFDGDRRMRAERPEEVHLERRETMRLPREEAERTEQPITPGEPDAGQRADALVSRPGPVEDPLVVGDGRDDHRLRASHDRPEEAFADGHGPAQLRAGADRPRADLGGERELLLILAREPDVDERAGDEGRRGARHALEDLGEIRPRAGRSGQLDEGSLGHRGADGRARLLLGRARAHGHIPR